MTDEVMNVPAEELPEDTTGATAPEESAEERMPRFSEMTKIELVDALRAIVDQSRATEHREAQAIKGAYYALRNKEAIAELEKFVAEGGNPAEFESTPDETEAEMRDLVARFRDIRSAWLEADQKIRQANLEEKQGIIVQLKEIASDIDNVNVNFQKFQDLQKQFKEKADIPRRP